jgi:hypothetical protein
MLLGRDDNEQQQKKMTNSVRVAHPTFPCRCVRFIIMQSSSALVVGRVERDVV